MAATKITKVPYVDKETVITAQNLNDIQDAINANADELDKKKAAQSAVSDPTASGTSLAFISGITQNAAGVISPVKKTVQSSTQSQAGVMSAADKKKLDGIASGAEVNVNPDWNATSGDAQILNKPVNLVQDANYVHTDNNFTAAEKSKLSGIAEGATKVTVDSVMSDTSANPVQNKAIGTTLKAGTAATAAYHLGFYIGEDGGLCQLDE